MSLKLIKSSCPCCESVAIGKVLACKDYTVSGETFDVWECQACTIRFTQNIPDQDSSGKYYQSDNYISHSDTGNGLVNKIYKIARNYTLSWKMNLLGERLGEKVEGRSLLDIGAGTGAFLQRASKSGWSVMGLEPDEGARKLCKVKYNLELEVPEELFRLPPTQYDAITMWHVLEHVHQLHDYMEEIRRLLKPKGIVLLALPNYTSRDARHYKEYWAAYDVPRHLYHFSPQAMANLTTQHQLKLEAIKPMWLDAFYISMLSEEYKKGKSNLVLAVINGMKSNLRALRANLECSSLVYVIRHKDYTK